MISVGYRVNSLCGTQFRIWANKILKDYLVKGYALNEKRLQSQIEKYETLKQSIKLIDNIIDHKPLSTSESEGLLKVIGDFSYALDTLDRYDYGKLELAHISDRAVKRISYEEAKGAIKIMQGRLSDSTLFGHEKDDSFRISKMTQKILAQVLKLVTAISALPKMVMNLENHGMSVSLILKLRPYYGNTGSTDLKRQKDILNA
jgi:hypothetical protein